jgi:phage tail-like protein
VAQFTVNPDRHDPYKQFKFRVKWNGQIVAGVSKVSALRRTTEVIEHREGGDPSTTRKSPGRTQFEPIILVRGITHDTEFESWANKVWRPGHESASGEDRGEVTPAAGSGEAGPGQFCTS